MNEISLVLTSCKCRINSTKLFFNEVLQTLSTTAQLLTAVQSTESNEGLCERHRAKYLACTRNRRANQQRIQSQMQCVDVL